MFLTCNKYSSNGKETKEAGSRSRSTHAMERCMFNEEEGEVACRTSFPQWC